MFFTLFFGMIMFLSLSHESYYAYAEKPVKPVNATSVEPVNATLVESVNATSTELVYEPTNVAKKSCNALEKENKTKSEGNEKAKTNNDCDSEADAFAEYFNEELDSIFYELDLILDEFNVDKEKSHTKVLILCQSLFLV